MRGHGNIKKSAKRLATKIFLDKFEYLFIILLTLFYFLFFSGYTYYTSDHTTQITSILHFFDNELYQKDLEMQILNPLSVKMIPHLILFSISKITIIPTYIIYVIAYLVTTFFIFLLIYKISFKLFSSEGIGLFACILLLFVTRGHNIISLFNILTRELVPYFIAVPFHLLCFYLVLQNKYKSAFFFSALLFYIHGQISIFTIITVISTILLYTKDFKLVIESFGIYLALISPMLFSLLINFNPFTDYVAKYSIFHLIKFRMHLQVLPEWDRVWRCIGMILCLIVLIHMNKSRKIKYWSYSLIVISILGLIFSKLIPLDAVLLLYPLRVDVFLRIFFVILLSGEIFQLVQESSRKKGTYLSSIRYRFVSFLVILIVLFSIGFLFTFPYIDYPQIKPPNDSLTDISNYVKYNTPKNSLIISPPFIEGIRLYTERSNVVDFKTHPIGRGNKLQDEWYTRLLTLCNITEFKGSAWDISNECQYASLSKDGYLSLCHKYKADYFITYINNQNLTDILIYKNYYFGLYKC